MTPSDGELSFESWYADVAEPLSRRIAQQVGDPVLGRELAAEAFARAYAKWRRVGRMESPEGWVFRTAINLSRRAWRRRQIEKRAIAKIEQGRLPTKIDEPDIAIQGHGLDSVVELVNDLPDRMRTAVQLRYWDELSEAEVAAQMNTSAGSASATLSNARRRLRDALTAEEEEQR